MRPTGRWRQSTPSSWGGTTAHQIDRVQTLLLESRCVPIYEYVCRKCGHRFERIQKFSDPHVKKCPECGGAVEQVLTAAAVQFKGSGWYVADYARKGSAGSAKKDEAAVKGSAEKSAGEKSESKPPDSAKPEKKS